MQFSIKWSILWKKKSLATNLLKTNSNKVYRPLKDFISIWYQVCHQTVQICKYWPHHPTILFQNSHFTNYIKSKRQKIKLNGPVQLFGIWITVFKLPHHVHVCLNLDKPWIWWETMFLTYHTLLWSVILQTKCKWVGYFCWGLINTTCISISLSINWIRSLHIHFIFKLTWSGLVCL